MAQQTVETYRNGQLISTTTVTVPDAQVNADALVAKMAQAVASNQTFLGLASPTNAQTLQQVQRLTRQVNALLKLQASDLDDITGT